MSLESVGVDSVSLLQCRLLMTVFDVGHGLYPAAYVSIGTVARVGVPIGIHESSNGLTIQDSQKQGEIGESHLIWRGTLVLER